MNNQAPPVYSAVSEKSSTPRTFTRPSGPPPGSSPAVRRQSTIASIYQPGNYSVFLPLIIKSLNRLQNPQYWKEYKNKSSLLKLFLKKKYSKTDLLRADDEIFPSPKYKNFYKHKEEILATLQQTNIIENLNAIRRQLRIPVSLDLHELAQLVFFDCVVYIDNSGSMSEPKRQKEYKSIMETFMQIVAINESGLSLRFMNNHENIAGAILEDMGIDIDRRISSPELLATILNSPHVAYYGVTPLATKLHKNVLQPFVYDKLLAGTFTKPLLVMVLTDGEPYGEDPGFTIRKVVLDTQKMLEKHGWPPASVLYQFGQVGNDRRAAQSLDDLDNDPLIGDVIDCNNVYEKEKLQLHDDVANRIFYVKKLALGPIDEKFDLADELTM
ncbi:hypothetical protein BABINDRAFT_160625 [Babjeviella inositovora NRRL Y-12698]|uniref:VWFA domain-containing protein n=1 Tax=Babjeviella inositovora NRRL Y-12698 TaxID=984486 RepID=A0A1E3QU78_9ASCO|nr:uncharacterized protein BABINDRAFT_160625 [Babjeviella inositovora NRRL Y-12698]ODQ81248.1 hypothetical protein BABINDRAFT_160625 [Babjeviella inositovora NRRL Y-12698]